MISILHNDEIGLGLQAQSNNKLGVKPDNSGNIQFEVSEAGLKGNVALPQTFDPSALQQQIAALEQAKQAAETKANKLQNALDTEKAKVQDLEGKVTALENRKDLHASNLTLDNATNEVVLTVEGGSELRVGLGKFLNVIPTSRAVWNEIKALPTFKDDLLAVKSTSVYVGTFNANTTPTTASGVDDVWRRRLTLSYDLGVIHIDFKRTTASEGIIMTLPSSAPTPLHSLSVQTWDGGEVYISANSKDVRCRGLFADRRYVVNLTGLFNKPV